jgi:hypothetical protein
MPTSIKSFFRQHVVPWFHRKYPDQKYIFQRTQSYAVRTTQQLWAKFWTPADWALYSPDLNLLDFSICSVLQAKGQAMPHANLVTLRMSIASE